MPKNFLIMAVFELPEDFDGDDADAASLMAEHMKSRRGKGIVGEKPDQWPPMAANGRQWPKCGQNT